ncbi:hypothetical protein [Novosphingobium sp. AP12]|uniref:hypothetical protein n=1 Tax=Novosphingobium sp. AP12 TaxID=1144305 RepID=UPI0012F9ED53|nr:hypothetical protein [Novosphingobium sp. AP12]
MELAGRSHIKAAFISAVGGSAIAAVICPTLEFFFGQLKNDAIWLIPTVMFFWPFVFMIGLIFSTIAMIFIVLPITWPFRRWIGGHKVLASALLGVLGYLLGSWISFGWLQGNTGMGPWDRSGVAGPTFGVLCCLFWPFKFPKQ